MPKLKLGNINAYPMEARKAITAYIFLHFCFFLGGHKTNAEPLNSRQEASRFPMLTVSPLLGNRVTLQKLFLTYLGFTCF